MNFQGDVVSEYHQMVSTLVGRDSYSLDQKILDLDMKNRVNILTRPSIEESTILEPKPITFNLCYAFFGAYNTLLVLIVVDLVDQ